MQKNNPEGNKIFPEISWDKIETVMLDMDGTLLDKHFDDYFWEVYVPEHYSLLHNISVNEAKKQLLEKYRRVESTLEWTDLEYWSHELGLDIAELKMRINHLIGVHPYVIEFLEFCLKTGKKLYLITNAHSKTLSIKLEQTSIGPWFDRVVCAEEVGCAKEDHKFWIRLQEILSYDPRTTLLADDTEKVLRSAASINIAHLIFVARSSSRQPVRYSPDYPSIDFFKELIPSKKRS
ncbi:MAG: haloacid dehalogenase [Desulfobulbus sp.]|nr:MAG: haloacid dehalogenase [Desulfobulbus sp.]